MLALNIFDCNLNLALVIESLSSSVELNSSPLGLVALHPPLD
jgi:hypothetical protein